MEIGNVIVHLFVTYYALYILQMIFFKGKRLGVQQSNLRLDELRNKSFKTLEEQKEFINIKYPKRNRFEWTFRNILDAAIYMISWTIAFVSVYSICIHISNYFGWIYPIWFAIAFVMIVPIIINIILKKFHLEKDDLGVFLRGWRGK